MSVAQPAHLALAVTPATLTITQHEPARARIEIANHTDRTVELDLGIDRRAYVELLITPPGGAAAWTQIPPREGGGRWGGLVLASGEIEVEPVFLDLWRAPREVGVHRYEPRLLSYAFDAAPPAPIVASAAEVTVRPRDEALLRRLCSELCDAAIGAEDREARNAAAAALAWIPDPIAVPFIDRALRDERDPRTSIWLDLIPALAAIDTVEAVEVLYREAVTDRGGHVPGSGRPPLARLFLYRMAHGDRHLGDQALWRRIEALFA